MRSCDSRDQLVVLVTEVPAEGITALGDDSAAGRRLDECLEYFRFAEAELTSLMQRWSAHREKWLAGRRTETQ
ncbi:hypothetical protein [Lentzea sp. HUAS12]|uniref:hypothetical protein n=1 Tax=Lentzea sp. HUAS12 TaxID=2951806 RepID=UPI00209EA5EB|nr:hypothetical protein [Lentzea sp. HUAS12]USX52807.1 hypothetical protein ND450_01540 [Lentzea sp. HUAS12]